MIWYNIDYVSSEKQAGMPEWTIGTVCKTVARKGSPGSNPGPSTQTNRDDPQRMIDNPQERVD